MPQLQAITLDSAQAERELTEFSQFLQDNTTFSETAVVAELKKKQHLSCLIGSMHAGVPKANVFKFEFQIQGVFRADLVVGNSNHKRLRSVLVEFEGADDNSLFGAKETNQMRDWSRQLEHGFGQLVDWAWAIHDTANTQIFKNAFGCEDLSAVYLLVCGRDDLMDDTEKKRFFWRSHKVILNGTPASCLTYDGLRDFFQATIEAIRSYGASSP